MKGSARDYLHDQSLKKLKYLGIFLDKKRQSEVFLKYYLHNSNALNKELSFCIFEGLNFVPVPVMINKIKLFYISVGFHNTPIF